MVYAEGKSTWPTPIPTNTAIRVTDDSRAE